MKGCRRRGAETTYDDETDWTAELAERFAIPLVDFLDVVGGGWSPVDIDPADAHDIDWFVSGDPVQVMLGVGGDEVVITTPQVTWAPPRVTPANPGDRRDLSDPGLRAWLHRATREAAARRRRSFAYCAYCRRLTAPEHLVERRIRSGRASTYLWVAF